MLCYKNYQPGYNIYIQFDIKLIRQIKNYIKKMTRISLSLKVFYYPIEYIQFYAETWSNLIELHNYASKLMGNLVIKTFKNIEENLSGCNSL